jgi:hypothetical protein
MVYNVWVVSDNRVVELKCVEVETVDLGTPTEAPHETPTFAAPPTFTPAVFASSTPTPPTVTPTQEIITPAPHPTATPTPGGACYGTVTAQPHLRVRNEPYGAILGVLEYGARVELFGGVWDSDGAKWYDVRWGAGFGYVHGDWISDLSPGCGAG